MKTLTECALILCCEITATKLRALSYGVVVIVIVFKEKAKKIPSTRVIGARIVIKEIAIRYQISSDGLCVKEEQLLTANSCKR